MPGLGLRLEDCGGLGSWRSCLGRMNLQDGRGLRRGRRRRSRLDVVLSRGLDRTLGLGGRRLGPRLGRDSPGRRELGRWVPRLGLGPTGRPGMLLGARRGLVWRFRRGLRGRPRRGSWRSLLGERRRSLGLGLGRAGGRRGSGGRRRLIQHGGGGMLVAMVVVVVVVVFVRRPVLPFVAL